MEQKRQNDVEHDVSNSILVRLDITQYFLNSRNRTLSLHFLISSIQTVEPSEMLEQKREKGAFEVETKSQESSGEATPLIDISTSEIAMNNKAHFDYPSISNDGVLGVGVQELPEIIMKTPNQVNIDDKEKSLDSEHRRYTLSANQVTPAENLRDIADDTFLKADREAQEDTTPYNLPKKRCRYSTHEEQQLLDAYIRCGGDWDSISRLFPDRSLASVSKLSIF
jgi:hypothetical protein